MYERRVHIQREYIMKTLNLNAVANNRYTVTELFETRPTDVVLVKEEVLSSWMCQREPKQIFNIKSKEDLIPLFKKGLGINSFNGIDEYNFSEDFKLRITFGYHSGDNKHELAILLSKHYSDEYTVYRTTYEDLIYEDFLGAIKYLENFSIYNCSEAWVNSLSANIKSKYHPLSFEFSGDKEEEVVKQYHGLAAYSGKSDIESKLDYLINNDIVFCGSDKAIGPVGIVFDGYVHKMFSDDARSEQDQRNEACRDTFCSEEEFVIYSKSIKGTRKYVETWTTLDHVISLWCHKDASDALKDEVVLLSNKYDLPIFWGFPERLGSEEI